MRTLFEDYKEVTERVLAKPNKNDNPVVGQSDLGKVAQLIQQIKKGSRKFESTEDAIAICREMFDAGFAFRDTQLN